MVWVIHNKKVVFVGVVARSIIMIWVGQEYLNGSSIDGIIPVYCALVKVLLGC